MEAKILKEIKEAKGTFFKRLSKTIFDERVESYHLKKLKKVHYKMARAFESSCKVSVTPKRELINYKKLNEILAIYRVILKFYKKDLDTYDPMDVVPLCEKIYKKYHKKYWSIFIKKLAHKDKGLAHLNLNGSEAFLELAYRGFKPRLLINPVKSKNEYYIKSDSTSLVHPIKVKAQAEAVKYQKYLGIKGHVGYHDPSRN